MRLPRFSRMRAAVNHRVVGFGAQTKQKQRRTSHRGSKQGFLSPLMTVRRVREESLARRARASAALLISFVFADIYR
jgi:hypothetical protein